MYSTSILAQLLLYVLDGPLANISLTSSFLATSTAVKPSGFYGTRRRFGQPRVTSGFLDSLFSDTMHVAHLDVCSSARQKQLFDLRFVPFCAGHEKEEIHWFHTRFQQLVQPVIRSLFGEHPRVVEVVFDVVPVVVIPSLGTIDSCGLRVGTQLLDEVEQRDDAPSVRNRQASGSSGRKLVPGQACDASARRGGDRQAHRGGAFPCASTYRIHSDRRSTGVDFLSPFLSKHPSFLSIGRWFGFTVPMGPGSLGPVPPPTLEISIRFWYGWIHPSGSSSRSRWDGLGGPSGFDSLSIRTLEPGPGRPEGEHDPFTKGKVLRNPSGWEWRGRVPPRPNTTKEVDDRVRHGASRRVDGARARREELEQEGARQDTADGAGERTERPRLTPRGAGLQRGSVDRTNEGFDGETRRNRRGRACIRLVEG
eukprot:scaffold772_cov339-Pavlova_lutheri.AAC.35